MLRTDSSVVCLFVAVGLQDEKGVLGFTLALCSVLGCCYFCVAKLCRGIYQLKTYLINFSDNNENTMNILPLLLFSSATTACQLPAQGLFGSKVHLIYGSRQILCVCGKCSLVFMQSSMLLVHFFLWFGLELKVKTSFNGGREEAI